MSTKPTYEDGHIVVAAVRVLLHRDPRPPTPEAVAELLGLPAEFVRSAVIGLGQLGILNVIENPFEIRIEIGDHGKLEELPRAAETPSIKDELDGFIKRKKREVEDTEKMLSVDEIEKKRKDKMSKLEDEMKKMKGRTRPPVDWD